VPGLRLPGSDRPTDAVSDGVVVVQGESESAGKYNPELTLAYGKRQEPFDRIGFQIYSLVCIT